MAVAACGSGSTNENATGSSASSPGASGAGGASASTGAAGPGSTAATSGGTGGVGGPGCGLPAAAFCDTFDAPAAKPGREGDLDPTKWSVARGEAQLPTGNGVVFGIGPATLPTCRDGLPAQVFPPNDTLVCAPNGDVASSHMLMAVGAQNYGQNSLRIRQPFDFTARTGKIVFDAEGYVLSSLLGWISLSVTEDPAPIPSFAIGDPGVANNEGGSAPRSGFEVQFQNICPGASPPAFALSMIDVFSDYKDSISKPDQPTCILGKEGKLNHFEITVSQSRIEVYVSPYSEDGKTFAAPTMVYAADVKLPFSRGYVQLSTYNHATIKYSHDNGFGATHPYDAWVTRWDNVGFDGPIFSSFREYEIADSLVPGMNGWNISGPVMSVGYTVPDQMNGPKDKLVFHGVNLDKVASARIALVAWYLTSKDPSMDNFTLRFRLNGKTWHDRPLNASEIALLTNTHNQGQIAQMFDVPVEDLVSGDNTLEFVASGIPESYPPAVAGIDLVLAVSP
jgi:hypothetical protein